MEQRPIVAGKNNPENHGQGGQVDLTRFLLTSDQERENSCEERGSSPNGAWLKETGRYLHKVLPQTTEKQKMALKAKIP
ncbi:hypothetical protein SESBI_36064 [Sesbania bispinosa]|nr:hypothetical protein SESBI_36064 [Sesbania bispinosa]